VKPRLCHNLDSTAEQILQICDKPPWEPRAGLTTYGNEKVDITVWAGLATGHRAKYTDALDPMALGYLQNLRAVRLKQVDSQKIQPSKLARFRLYHAFRPRSCTDNVLPFTCGHLCRILLNAIPKRFQIADLFGLGEITGAGRIRN
jgi:hypothetical protein